MEIGVRGWKVVGTKLGANKRPHKVVLSREFTVKAAADEFLSLVLKEHPEAMIETIYLVDNGNV